MTLVNLLVSLIPIIIFIIFLIKYNKINIKNIHLNNILNVIFCELLSVILSLIFSHDTLIKYPFAIVYAIFTRIVPNMSFESGLGFFIYLFFTAGFVEEISKWIAIKISKPKTPYKILLNSIFISLIFITLEDYAYIYNHSTVVGMLRNLLPLHIIFQVIMALLMIKAYEKKNEHNKNYSLLLQISSIFIPALVHTFYDYIIWNVTTENMNYPIVILVAIFIYAITFMAIIRIKKKFPDNENIEKNEKTKLNIKKLILIIVMCAFWFIVYSVDLGDNNTVKINETLKIEEPNIEIKVTSIEPFDVTDIFFNNKNYVKVHLEIKNNESEMIEISSLFAFKLLENNESIRPSSYMADDIINLDIAGGESSSGYLYFEAKLTEGLKLEYLNSNLTLESGTTENEYYYIELN